MSLAILLSVNLCVLFRPLADPFSSFLVGRSYAPVRRLSVKFHFLPYRYPSFPPGETAGMLIALLVSHVITYSVHENVNLSTLTQTPKKHHFYDDSGPCTLKIAPDPGGEMRPTPVGLAPDPGGVSARPRWG
jgi:hypothetical protein